MNNPIAKDFSVRFKTALREAGIRVSASVIAHEFNLRYWGTSISSHAVRNWLMGVSIPKQDKLMVLAQWLRVTPEALLFGAQPVRPADEQFTEKPVNLVDQQLIAQYFKLLPEHRVTVRVMVDALLALGHQSG
jgi:transcriptional regulator with XRE-family HTH domain